MEGTPFSSAFTGVAPNAERQAPPKAGATQERRLLAVACKRWFGKVPASLEPDNHLEGSSIRLYSVVSCATRHVHRQPNEEAQMALYGGIDLHANNRVVVV